MTKRDIQTILKNRKLCIYGAGTIALNFSASLLSILEINADCFCDKDPEKWGKEILIGVPCISPEELYDIGDTVCFLLVGLYHTKSALACLKEYKNVSRIITFNDLIAMDEVISGILKEDISQYERNSIISEIKRKETDLGNSMSDTHCIKNKSGKDIAIYTCITGEYDELHQPCIIDEKADYYCITDKKPENPGAFRWIPSVDVIPCSITDNIRRSRYCKIRGSELFKDYKYSIWIDGNVQCQNSIVDYVNRLNEHGFMSHDHAYEDCIFSESVRIIAGNIENNNLIRLQMKGYQDEGMPRHYGMLHTAILVRENRNPICNCLMRKWWHEVYSKSFRDQLSVTYCLWKMGIPVDEVNQLGPDMRGNPDFRWLKSHHTTAQ